ncbi:MAG: hypothetical protein HUU45_07800, partial [Leptospiraceae bacterium]|nr:hypothetical protein [Leptospiraceae bacterium]
IQNIDFRKYTILFLVLFAFNSLYRGLFSLENTTSDLGNSIFYSSVGSPEKPEQTPEEDNICFSFDLHFILNTYSLIFEPVFGKTQVFVFNEISFKELSIPPPQSV